MATCIWSAAWRWSPSSCPPVFVRLMDTGEGPWSACRQRMAGRWRWNLIQAREMTSCCKLHNTFTTIELPILLVAVSWTEVHYLVVRSVFSPRQALLSGAQGRQIEAGSFGERRSDTEQTRSSRCTSSTRQRTDLSCLRWKTQDILELSTKTK